MLPIAIKKQFNLLLINFGFKVKEAHGLELLQEAAGLRQKCLVKTMFPF